MVLLEGFDAWVIRHHVPDTENSPADFNLHRYVALHGGASEWLICLRLCQITIICLKICSVMFVPFVSAPDVHSRSIRDTFCAKWGVGKGPKIHKISNAPRRQEVAKSPNWNFCRHESWIKSRRFGDKWPDLATLIVTHFCFFPGRSHMHASTVY